MLGLPARPAGQKKKTLELEDSAAGGHCQRSSGSRGRKQRWNCSGKKWRRRLRRTGERKISWLDKSAPGMRLKSREAGPTFTGIVSGARPPSHRDSRWPPAGWQGGLGGHPPARGGLGGRSPPKFFEGVCGRNLLFPSFFWHLLAYLRHRCK